MEKDTTCDILLFGTMGDIGPTVERSLTAHSYSVRLVDFAQNTLRDEPGYRRELGKAIAACNPRIIIPIGNQTAMARLKPSLTQIVPVSDAATVELLDSKVRCSALAGGLGIRQPRLFASALEVDRFPVIFKRDRSFGGSGVLRPRSREALQRLVEHEPQNPYLIEELIEGTDYSVDAVRCGDFFQAACYRSLSNRGQGPSTMREPAVREDLCRTARKILDHVGYQGVCGLDFRVSDDGTAYFLECNPRFTGGIETQIAAGFDIPYLLVKQYSLSHSKKITW
ncbi:MAG: ATP-grasp domain-containing protein [Bacteroidaceae bacterium]|nr:ATP-grasp domain-containing protein [Bacteroidaceae bacterium]